MESKATQRQYDELTGVRAIAAWMVYFHHYPMGTTALGTFGSLIAKEMHIGVTLFFTLSGFLIYFNYADKANLTKEFYLGYIKNRIARIYPLYFFVVGITALVFLIRGSTPRLEVVRDFFLQVTFIRGFSDTFKFIGVGQGWTLTVEETFYFLFPVLLVFIRKRGFILTLLGVYLTGIILYLIGNTYNLFSFFTPAVFMSFYTFFGRAFEFFAGMWLARRLKNVLKSPSEQTLKTGFQTKTTIGLVGFLGGLIMLSQYRNLASVPFIQSLSNIVAVNDILFSVFILINNLYLPIFICFLFYGLVTEQSKVRDFLRTPFMVLFGKTSYAFYLIHTGVIAEFVFGHVLDGLIPVFFIINFICIGLYRFVEEPSRKFIRALKWPEASSKPARAPILSRLWAFPQRISLGIRPVMYTLFGVPLLVVLVIVPFTNTVLKFFPGNPLNDGLYLSIREVTCQIDLKCNAAAPFRKTLHYTDEAGSSASLTFEGDEIALVYTRADSRGKVDVWLDGREVKLLKQRINGAPLWQQIWSSGTLTPGKHQLTLKFAEGPYIDIDAAIVHNGLSRQVLDNTDPAWVFDGNWQQYTPDNFK